MTDGKVTRLFLLLQTAHHMAAFERAGNQRGQFRGINIGADLASSLPLLGDRLHTTKPRTESLASFRSQPWVAIIAIDGRVQQRAASGHQPGAPVPKVTHNSFEAVNGIWDLLCTFEARIHCNFPSVVEGFSCKLLLALKMAVNSAFFESRRPHE